MTLGCVAAAIGAVALNREGGRVGVAAGACLVTAAALPMVWRLRQDRLDGVGLYAAASVLMFAVMALFWEASPFMPPPFIDRDDVASALPIVAIGLVAFGLGARLFGPARTRPALSMRDADGLSTRWLLAVLLASLAAAVVGVSTGTIGYATTLSPANADTPVSALLYQLTAAGSLVVLAVALRQFATGRAGWVLAVTVGAEALVGFATGFKGLAVIPMAYVLLARMACARTVPWRSIGVTAVVTITVLLPASAAYRAAIRGPGDSSQFAQRSGFASLLGRQARTYATFRFRLIDHVALIHTLTPSVYPYADGSHYQFLPAIVGVPRALWPDKPINVEGGEFSQTYWQVPRSLGRTSTPITQVGDLYRNFGYVGVGVGLFVWGMLIGAFVWVCTRWRSPRSELVYISSLVTWVANIESDLPQLISTATRSTAVAIAVGWLLLPGRSSTPGAQWMGSRLPRFWPASQR